MYELLFTSAPNTLDGAGYGVVGKSRDFPGRVEKHIRLRLNEYDFTPSGSSAGGLANADESPAVFSYTRLGEGDHGWHILSRVGPGGRDYTQREVFLAHHVVLSNAEIAGGNVPMLMLSPTFFTHQWDGVVGELPSRPPPKPLRAALQGHTWSALAGDPNWARHWVNHWLERRPQPRFVILADSAQCLNLFAEAASLLNASEGATFLSNLTSNREGLRLDWIGLAAGSRIADSVMARLPDQVLDLRKPLGPAPSPARWLMERGSAAPSAQLARPSSPAQTASRSTSTVQPDLLRSQAQQANPSVDRDWDRLIGGEILIAATKQSRSPPDSRPESLPPPPMPPRKLVAWQKAIVATAAVAVVSTIVGFIHVASSHHEAVVAGKSTDDGKVAPNNSDAVRVSREPGSHRTITSDQPDKGPNPAGVQSVEPTNRVIDVPVTTILADGLSNLAPIKIHLPVVISSEQKTTRRWFAVGCDGKGLNGKEGGHPNKRPPNSMSDAGLKPDDLQGCQLIIEPPTRKELVAVLYALPCNALVIEGTDKHEHHFTFQLSWPVLPLAAPIRRWIIPGWFSHGSGEPKDGWTVPDLAPSTRAGRQAGLLPTPHKQSPGAVSGEPETPDGTIDKALDQIGVGKNSVSRKH